MLYFIYIHTPNCHKIMELKGTLKKEKLGRQMLYGLPVIRAGNLSELLIVSPSKPLGLIVNTACILIPRHLSLISIFPIRH